ncbi:carboxylating nicotinate-nucleotide diphosphorylase [Alkalihalobacillus sp. LMS39]|uniref:carboxylating nicotinate-nucleotide diphosphorylase n=1 Tax=Alkalihalobacillus sp. LMS39 TaxID=2924032 RepID=UPI001FB436A0|nr:carboxylating nicotinate-nucleotide diphosphorylase [Alkalihalobacillus sp. LMS39]UOE95527.1 carboxylating nicotinate-nucleotide diphosphorylase [Alkalihalobacillus sp. LMS39]
MNRLLVKQQLQQFFIEDIGHGDLTSMLFENKKGTGDFVVKQSGVVAGLSIISDGYQLVDSNIQVNTYVEDGQWVEKGTIIATASGPVSALLSGERVILNLVQRMSGIATLTNEAVRSLSSDHTRLCDTRKTTPGLRMFEKYAVLCGGGFNHRIGLYDGVMIKDNHITACGSIKKAVEKVKQQLGHMVKIEVETETETQVKEAIEAGADVIMFDNRLPDEVEQFIKLVPPQIVTEASGGITLENISDYSHCGVDYISLGFLTHSVKALDISFNLKGGMK